MPGYELIGEEERKERKDGMFQSPGHRQNLSRLRGAAMMFDDASHHHAKRLQENVGAALLTRDKKTGKKNWATAKIIKRKMNTINNVARASTKPGQISNALVEVRRGRAIVSAR